VELCDGEITVLPYRDKILDLVLDMGWSALIYTNAILYNKKVAEILSRRLSAMDVSLDCGTAETYQIIKGRDVFERVCDNLEKYISTGCHRLCLKYILLPGYNDNYDDIENFVAIAKRVNAFSIILSNDLYNVTGIPGRVPRGDITPKLLSMSEYFFAAAKAHGVKSSFSYGNFTRSDCRKLEKLRNEY
jgi:molybdenum cofactor biosynthesis enzyme MoaA